MVKFTSCYPLLNDFTPVDELGLVYRRLDNAEDKRAFCIALIDSGRIHTSQEDARDVLEAVFGGDLDESEVDGRIHCVVKFYGYRKGARYELNTCLVLDIGSTLLDYQVTECSAPFESILPPGME